MRKYSMCWTKLVECEEARKISHEFGNCGVSPKTLRTIYKYLGQESFSEFFFPIFFFEIGKLISAIPFNFVEGFLFYTHTQKYELLIIFCSYALICHWVFEKSKKKTSQTLQDARLNLIFGCCIIIRTKNNHYN